MKVTDADIRARQRRHRWQDAGWADGRHAQQNHGDARKAQSRDACRGAVCLDDHEPVEAPVITPSPWRL